MEYKRFRVKSVVKSFRDLEVYQKTIELSTNIFNLTLPKKYANKLRSHHEKLLELSQRVPKFIAESYGDKFTSIALSSQKLERAQSLIADIIAHLDILRSLLANEEVCKEALDNILVKYQRQKRKILNLQRAWQRVFKR